MFGKAGLGLGVEVEVEVGVGVGRVTSSRTGHRSLAGGARGLQRCPCATLWFLGYGFMDGFG